jgi:spermidine synthase
MLLALAGVCTLAAAGLVLAYASRRVAQVAAASALALGAAIFLAPRWDRLQLTSGEQVYFHRTYVFPQTELRFFHEDTYGGITTVVENAVGAARSRVLLTNGKFQGNDSGEMAAQDGFALAPMMFARRWDDALVIGLGTARSAYVVATMGFANVGCAEIAPGIVQAARWEFAHVNGGVLDRPNIHTVLEDARNILLVDQRSYDLVSMELTSVWFAGATNLYSREFYQVARSRLRPGGVLQQWVQLHHIAVDDLATVLATMRDGFAYVSLFVLGKQGVVIGTHEPQLTQEAFFSRLAAHAPELGEHDAAATVQRLHASRLLSPADVDALIARRSPRLNTDKNRRLEYTTARYGFERHDRYPENLAALAESASFAPQPVASDARGALADAARAVDAAAVRSALTGR